MPKIHSGFWMILWEYFNKISRMIRSVQTSNIQNFVIARGYFQSGSWRPEDVSVQALFSFSRSLCFRQNMWDSTPAAPLLQKEEMLSSLNPWGSVNSERGGVLKKDPFLSLRSSQKQGYQKLCKGFPSQKGLKVATDPSFLWTLIMNFKLLNSTETRDQQQQGNRS